MLAHRPVKDGPVDLVRFDGYTLQSIQTRVALHVDKLANVCEAIFFGDETYDVRWIHLASEVVCFKNRMVGLGSNAAEGMDSTL